MGSTEAGIVVVGRIVKAHGIRGELVVDIRTDSPDDRFTVGSVLAARSRDGATRSLTVAAVRPHAGRLLVFFEGVSDRDGADALRGTLLVMNVAELPPIDDPDEFYDHQLEGLAAVRLDGTRVGTVLEVVHGPGGELLLIDRDGEELLVPFVQQIVPEVDLVGGRVVLDPPAGLLDGD